jgi:hypothetical protein
MKKQTALEWLINEMPVIDWTDPYWKIKLEKAKEMEKQQITDAYHFGISDEYVITAEHYYNKTFGGKDEQ